MTGPEVLDVARDAIITLVIVSAPLMLVGLAVGVAISLFQALTQIQEMTLVFVPKILAMFVAMLLVLPFMADSLQGHMMRDLGANHSRRMRRVRSRNIRRESGKNGRCSSTSHFFRRWLQPSCWFSRVLAPW